MMYKVTFPYILYEHRAARYDVNRGTYSSWDGEHVMWFYEKPGDIEWLDSTWRRWVREAIQPMKILSDREKWTVERV